MPRRNQKKQAVFSKTNIRTSSQFTKRLTLLTNKCRRLLARTNFSNFQFFLEEGNITPPPPRSAPSLPRVFDELVYIFIS